MEGRESAKHLNRSVLLPFFTLYLFCSLVYCGTGTNVAFDFAQKLLGVKSPAEFIELSTERARKQFETLTEQTKELTALAQKATLATTEPLKAGVTKAFGHTS
jgi:phasin family protein